MKTTRQSKSNHQSNSNSLSISNDQPAWYLYFNDTNERTLVRICLCMSMLLCVLAESIAILFFRMYRPVPSTPFSWLFCLICGWTLVDYVSSFSGVRTSTMCSLECLSDMIKLLLQLMKNFLKK